MSKQLIKRIEEMIKQVHCIGESPPTKPVNRGDVWNLLKDARFRIESLENDMKHHAALVDGIIERAIDQLSERQSEIRTWVGAVPATTLSEDLDFMDTIPDEL